jgi:uncharacterized metal-binding protein YceD (DUF177 family)
MTDRLRLSEASIRLDSMPADGRDLVLDVGEAERAALAQHLELGAVERLAVRLHADKFRGGMRVHGSLSATIVQPSVISLEPVTQEIDEPIDRVFLPGGEKDYAAAAGAEIFVDLEGEDVPDHFEGNEADLSALIIETLSLAVDPYPHAPGETVGELDIVDKDAESTSPFSKLKALKKGEGSG